MTSDEKIFDISNLSDVIELVENVSADQYEEFMECLKNVENKDALASTDTLLRNLASLVEEFVKDYDCAVETEKEFSLTVSPDQKTSMLHLEHLTKLGFTMIHLSSLTQALATFYLNYAGGFSDALSIAAFATTNDATKKVIENFTHHTDTNVPEA